MKFSLVFGITLLLSAPVAWSASSEQLGSDEELTVQSDTTTIHMQNYDGLEGYMSDSRIPGLALSIGMCREGSTEVSFNLAITVPEEAAVPPRLAKIRSTPQSVAEPIDICVADYCKKYTFKYDEYFGGVSSEIKVPVEAVTSGRTLRLLFQEGDADSLDFSFSVPFDIILRKICEG